MSVYKLMAQLPTIREMAKFDLSEATMKIDEGKIMQAVSRLKYGKFGAFSRSIEERLKVYLRGTTKNQRERMTERLLKKYNAVNFPLDGSPFYANMETIDELLTLLKSYYEQD